MFKQDQHVHFVGIGGIGMSGIADVLMTLGHAVSGSDLKLSETTRRLTRRGARIYRGHKAEHIEDASVVVVSSAINGNNPEIAAARKRGIPVVPRAEMLAELMRLKWGIAVAGTHGKTTTTALIGTILDAAGLDPTLVIGGRVNSLRGRNAKLGRGEYLVAEADESDRSFLKLAPTISVITNIDPEHMEQYESFAHLEAAFVDFANKVPFYGSVIACVDHPVVRSLLPRFQRRCITYGMEDAEYVARKIVQQEDRIGFDVFRGGEKLGSVEMEIVGKHHVLNALAAIAVAGELNIPFAKISKGLASFRGIARRFQILYREGPIVVDDYAHHPVEINATLDAARVGWPDHRLVVVMQPHRFSRYRALFDDFVSVLSKADAAVITDVYAAGEQPLHTWGGEKLCRSLSRRCPSKSIHFAPTTKEIVTMLQKESRRGDMILFLGAGDITKTAQNFSKRLISRS